MSGYEEAYLLMMSGTLLKKLIRQALTRVSKQAWSNELTTIIGLIQEKKYLAKYLTNCSRVSNTLSTSVLNHLFLFFSTELTLNF